MLKHAIVAGVLFLTYANSLIAQKLNINEKLEIIKLTPTIYLHVSTKTFTNYGDVKANGLVIFSDHEALIIDTPWDDSLTHELINWIKTSLKATVKAIIPTHWHEDCMGGIAVAHQLSIPSYGLSQTIEIGRTNNLATPNISFNDSLTLTLGNKQIFLFYPGEGHTTDNIVVWIPDENVLFGGCLIKDLNTKGKGNIADANLIEWPKSIERVKATFPNAKIVVPGHGTSGSSDLIDHTLSLF